MTLQSQHACYGFDRFVLDAGERRFESAELEIHLRPKTLDTLIYLVERRGHLVTKSELLEALWPGTIVTENVLMQCVRELREALGDDSKHPRFIQTVHRAGYRFIANVDETTSEGGHEYEVEDLAALSVLVMEDDALPSTVPIEASLTGRRYNRRVFTVFAMLLFVAGALMLGSWLYHRSPGLEFGERDWVLIADFDNQTGDSVFDMALRTELERGLSVSRYANFVPPGRVVDTLKLMQRPADMRITEQVGREISLRDGDIRAMVSGSIQEIGGTYAIALKLIDPFRGNTVAVFERQAKGKKNVLKTMHRLSEDVRRNLGEPLAAVVPPGQTLERVTTDSLEALTLYSRGLSVLDQNQWSRAATFFNQAINEDPDFALAYYFRGLSRMMLSQQSSADIAKAAELADEVTLRERLMIKATVATSTGDIQKAIDLWEAFIEQYPDDYRAHSYLSWHYLWAGSYQGWLDHQAACRRLRPNFAQAHFHAGWLYLVYEGDIEKAEAEFATVLALNPDFPIYRVQSIKAYSYWMQGNMEQASAEMREFREQKMALMPAGRQVSIRPLLARFYAFNGMADDALAMLETTRDMTIPADANDMATRFRFSRALIYQQMGREFEFEKLIREESATGLGIDRVEALGWLGISLARHGRTQEAHALQIEIGQETRHPPIDFWHPRLPVQLDRAKKAFSLQIEGDILLSEGQADSAIQRFDKVLAMVPPRNAMFATILTPRVWLAAAQSSAKAHEQKEDWDAAVTAYQLILKNKVFCFDTDGASAIWFDALQSIAPALEHSGHTADAAGYREEYLRLRPATGT